MVVAIQPRLGPAQITPEAFASQAFRTSADKLNRLPAQYRGAVVLGRFKTVDEALEHAGDSAHLEPHDAYLAFVGQDFTA